jgi:hypothetical protein
MIAPAVVLMRLGVGIARVVERQRRLLRAVQFLDDVTKLGALSA